MGKSASKKWAQEVCWSVSIVEYSVAIARRRGQNTVFLIHNSADVRDASRGE